jgi:CBS-domain-containing membrane protein
VRLSLTTLRRFTGFSFKRTGHLEKWISGLGGLVSILGVITISHASLGLDGSAGLVSSMGASAVLLFAVPHGQLSQPWPVFGGHLVSALIGVASAKLVAPPLLAAAVAVALAISAMYYLRCIHPPGGATALTAVAGGETVRALGFSYVLTPVLLNVLIILAVAFLFNLPFTWRRYPAVWAATAQSTASHGGHIDEASNRQEFLIAAKASDAKLAIRQSGE